MRPSLINQERLVHGNCDEEAGAFSLEGTDDGSHMIINSQRFTISSPFSPYPQKNIPTFTDKLKIRYLESYSVNPF